MPIEQDALGGRNDSVRIEIDGRIVAIVEQYTVEQSILRQPGAMSVRIGSAQTAQEILATVTPRKSRYRLFINDVLTQSGIVYGVAVPDSSATIVEIKGRDFLSVVFDAFVLEDKTFHEKTYKEFTRRVLDELGLTEAKGHKLITSNDVNRLKLTGRNVTASAHTIDTPSQPKTLTAKEKREAKVRALEEQQRIDKSNAAAREAERQAAESRLNRERQEAAANAQFGALARQEGKRTLGQVADNLRDFRSDPTAQSASASSIIEQRKVDELKTSAAGGTSEVIVQSLKIQLGWRWHDVLDREYKLAGLFLWCDAEGNFILARPNAKQAPSYRLLRQRNIDRLTTNVESASFQNDTTERHTRAVVYGQVGKGKKGRNKLRGEFVDHELDDSDFDAPITIHDRDIATKAQADYLARKTIAEERRAGWKLTYVVTGHITNLISAADGSSTNWAVDTVVDVDDRELGIQRLFYIEAVKFSRAPTLTEITLMRDEDLVFADDLFAAPIRVDRKIPRKADAGVADPASANPDPEADAAE